MPLLVMLVAVLPKMLLFEVPSNWMPNAQSVTLQFFTVIPVLPTALTAICVAPSVPSIVFPWQSRVTLSAVIDMHVAVEEFEMFAVIP